MEAHYLLDTNAVIYILREQPEGFLRRFTELQQGETALSVITYGELLFGIAKSNLKTKAVATLQELIQLVPVFPLPEAAASIYGAIRAELQAKGKIIGNNELWIAAHAISQDLILVTNNEKEFRRVNGLKIENWAR